MYSDTNGAILCKCGYSCEHCTLCEVSGGERGDRGVTGEGARGSRGLGLASGRALAEKAGGSARAELRQGRLRIVIKL